jgi:rsbT co-antagonist protein RsbR
MTSAADKNAKPDAPSIELNNVAITWALEQGTFRFFGIPSAMFWLNPSLLRMLHPLALELGIPLFRMLVAYNASIGTDEDYSSMIATLGTSFQDGFLAWGKAVSAAGWGAFELPVFNLEERRATVVVRNPWELEMQRGNAETWGCPFLQGKIMGIFSHAFKTNCWADETVIGDGSEEGARAIEIRVYPSNKTMSAELQRLRNARREEAARPLKETLQELWLSEEQQRAILTSLGEAVFTLDHEGTVTSFHVPAEHAAFYEDPDKVVGRPLAQVMPAEVVMAVTEVMHDVLRDGAPRTVSYSRVRGSDVRSFSTKISALHDPDGDLAGVTAIERDMTERVKAEQALADKVELIGRQAEAIRAMSTPILEVWDGILALPIIGAVDRSRSAEMTESLLRRITATRARYAILDLTGMDAIDTAAADHFGRIIRAAQLLGTECLVCGIRPAVAQTMTSLGAATTARTFGTMRSALASVVERRADAEDRRSNGAADRASGAGASDRASGAGASGRSVSREARRARR